MFRKKIIIDCIADLHGHTPEMPGGDLLLVAGDLTRCGSHEELMVFMDWILEQKYEKKIFIAGNHDHLFQKYPNIGFFPDGVDYLPDWGSSFKGLKIWGTPWSLTFDRINPRCASFTGTEEELEKHFSKIPDDVDIVIAHGPPFGIRDMTNEGSVGSRSLTKKLISLEKLKLVVFGHIHEQYGTWVKEKKKKETETQLGFKSKYPITFVNASHVNEFYEPVNAPIRIEL
jgi:3',5'-cyclic AMP phosphodiesterase CpdA